MVSPSIVMVREAWIDKTWIARPLPGFVLGCCRAAPDKPFSVRPLNPLIVMYSVQVPCTRTVIGMSLFSFDNVEFSDWPFVQFTVIVGTNCPNAGATAKAQSANTSRILPFIFSLLKVQINLSPMGQFDLDSIVPKYGGPGLFRAHTARVVPEASLSAWRRRLLEKQTSLKSVRGGFMRSEAQSVPSD